MGNTVRLREPAVPIPPHAKLFSIDEVVPLLKLRPSLLLNERRCLDQKTRVEIVREALSAPARQIAINVGEDGSVIVRKILKREQYNYGFDSQNRGAACGMPPGGGMDF